MYSRILVPVDGSPTSMSGLAEAVRMAALTGASIGRAVAAGVEVDAVLIEKLTERVADLAVAQAKDWRADLVVIGSQGRRGIDRAMMGSDAEQIVRQAPVPVLVVRNPGSTGATSREGRASRNASMVVPCT